MQLKPWEEKYITDLVENINHAEVVRYLSNRVPFPYTEQDAKDFIEMTKSTNDALFAIIVDGKAVGGIGIYPKTDIHCKNAELGYWLGYNYWNKGIISHAIQQIIPYAFERYDIQRLYASVFADNAGSIKVLEKNGFLRDTKFKQTLFKNGKFYDEVIYALRKD